MELRKRRKQVFKTNNNKNSILITSFKNNKSTHYIFIKKEQNPKCLNNILLNCRKTKIPGPS